MFPIVLAIAISCYKWITHRDQARRSEKARISFCCLVYAQLNGGPHTAASETTKESHRNSPRFYFLLFVRVGVQLKRLAHHFHDTCNLYGVVGDHCTAIILNDRIVSRLAFISSQTKLAPGHHLAKSPLAFRNIVMHFLS